MRLQSKRLSILSQPEAQEVYSIPVLNARDREHFFTFTEDELAAVKRLHNHRHRIYFLLMLGYFKCKPVCLKLQWKAIASDYQYIAERYFPGANLQNNTISRFVRIRYYRRIFQMLDYQRFSKELEQELLEQLFKHAAYYIDEAQLFNSAITFLESKQIAIPGYSTLQELISTAIHTEETRLSKLIDKKLSNKDEFLSLIDAGNKPLTLNHLKKLTRTYRPGEYKSEIARHQLLMPLATKAYPLIEQLKLPEGNIRYFALRCQQYDLRDLRALKREITLLHLICFVATRFRQANDSLTLSFMIAYKDYDEQAKLYRDDCVKQQALSVADAVEKVPKVLQLFIDDDITNTVEFGAVRDSAFDIISREELRLVCKKLSAIKPNKSQFTWEYVDNHFQRIIMNIRPLFRALDFGCRNNQSLQRQITTTRSALLGKESVPTMDGRLIKRQDKPFLKAGNTSDQHNLKRHELYLYKLLDHGIRNGDVFVENSLEYRSFDTYLVNDAVWRQRNKHLADQGLAWMTRGSDAHLASLESLFNAKLNYVGRRISAGSNSYIRRQPNADKLLWSRAVIAKDSVLTDKFFAHFDRKTIVNVIRKVHTETGFLDDLTPKTRRYKKSPPSTENLLACLIANGTFQGTYKFSASTDQQYKVLRRIEKDCFHEEALRKSIDSITSAAVQLPIFDDFRLSDGKSHSSADGQRFESKYGNPWVGRAPKYYAKKKGGIVYTLAASHFAVQGKVIPARSHESHHLFDLVYNNASALKSAIVSTDTHGTNQFNHAILNAFGYQFTPRYAKFKQRFLSEFSVEFTDDVVFSLVKPINWKLIRAEWETITKIFLSLGMRTVQQSTLVKKLCSFKQHNATMLALAEYNRVLKCLHLLDYADDKQLRQVIQESLNRGEQLQGLKRALAALGNNQFRGTSPDEMTQWNACADLLVNCIVYYNAMIMSSFKTYCIEAGDDKQLKHLRTISPASWEHILLTGFYDLADNDPHWDIDSAIKRLNLAA
jgi:TnpA family transposase